MKISTFEKLLDLAKNKGLTPEAIILDAVSAVQQEQQSPRAQIDHKKSSDAEE